MLDYDAPKDGAPAIPRDKLIEILTATIPDFADCPTLWWPSTSSEIYAGDVQMNGIKGQRFYLHVADASDTERAGKALNERLWAAGQPRSNEQRPPDIPQDALRFGH